MTETNNRTEAKLQNYIDNTPNLKPLVPNNIIDSNSLQNWDPNSNFVNLHKKNSSEVLAIDRSISNVPRKQDYSSILLNRQFSPPIFNTATDIESDLIKPTDCTVSQRINYKIDNVSGLSKDSYSMLNNSGDEDKISLKNVYDLLISEEEHLKLSGMFKQSCGQKKKTLDYSDYQTPPRKSEGFGFGNPSDYHKTYVGEDTRSYIEQNVREKDVSNHTITPPETLRINYSNLPYESETRLGVTTRTYKKMVTNFQ